MDTNTLILLVAATSQVAHNFAPGIIVISPAILWYAAWGE